VTGERVKVAVSQCLLGARVRHDGGHKLEPVVSEILAASFEWVPICPEVELGLGVPREPIDLVESAGDVRLVSRSGEDLTAAMRRYAEERVRELATQGVAGFVAKSRSPSCGVRRVRVQGAGGSAAEAGRGLFAETLMRRWPDLPVEEAEGLRDSVQRERFIARVLAYHRTLVRG
jgi:uncharacterized protein YbbK (DUF523 family)